MSFFKEQYINYIACFEWENKCWCLYSIGFFNELATSRWFLKWIAYGTKDCSVSSTRKKSIKVKGMHTVPTSDEVQPLKWLHAIKRAPPYPSDENFCIFSLRFVDDCFERDLKIYVIVVIIYNSEFLSFVFRIYTLLKSLGSTDCFSLIVQFNLMK